MYIKLISKNSAAVSCYETATFHSDENSDGFKVISFLCAGEMYSLVLDGSHYCYAENNNGKTISALC